MLLMAHTTISHDLLSRPSLTTFCLYAFNMRSLCVCRGRMGKGQSCTDPYCHYHMHIKTCGGAFIKVRSPDPKLGGSAAPSSGAGWVGSKRKATGTRAVKAAEEASAKRTKGSAEGASAAAAAVGEAVTSAGTRPIESFFRIKAAASAADDGSSVNPPGEASKSSSGGGGFRPSSAAAEGHLSGVTAEVTRSMPSSQHLGQISAASIKASAAEMRRACAEAAARRCQGEGGSVLGAALAGTVLLLPSAPLGTDLADERHQKGKTICIEISSDEDT